MFSIDDIPDLPDPVPWIVREAEWTVYGRCPFIDNGIQCRFIDNGHHFHLCKRVDKW